MRLKHSLWVPKKAGLLLTAGAMAGSGCGLTESAEEDRAIARPVHVGFELTPGPDTPEGETWFSDGEDVIRGVIILEPLDGEPEGGGTLMAGVLALSGDSSSRVRDIDARFDDGVVAVADGSLTVPGRDATYSWERFELRLEDASGDGVLDAGGGSVVGHLDSWFHPSEITDGQIAIEADQRAPETQLASTGFSPSHPFPYDAISAHFTKPVPVDALSDDMILLVDGEPVEASVSASDDAKMPNPSGNILIPLATDATVRPAEPIPLGAEVSVDVSDLVDLSGLDVSLREPLESPPDRGSALSNLDFAQGFEGWHHEGTIDEREEFQNAEPSSGERFIVLDGPSQLVAELALPDDADTLALTATGFSDWSRHPERAVAVDALRPGGDVVATTALGPTEEDDIIECETCVLRFRTHPTPLELDLADAAGDSIFLRVTIPTSSRTITRFEDGLFLSPPPRFAAAIEALSLQRAEPGG